MLEWSNLCTVTLLILYNRFAVGMALVYVVAVIGWLLASKTLVVI